MIGSGLQFTCKERGLICNNLKNFDIYIFLGTFSNIKFVAQLPASPPLKAAWKENVFSMISGMQGYILF